MKELVVISGKGGTGKTTIAAALASAAKDVVAVDCDVDAADLHLLLAPQIRKSEDFVGGKKASVIPAKCTGCGRCAEVCNFDAPHPDKEANGLAEKTYTINPIDCEGCGVCSHFCPDDAIEFKDVVNGRWFVSDTRFGPFVHARLKPAEENSGRLVALLRKEAKRIAEKTNRQLIITDGSPGIGCPVIASITGADCVLAVTEPTLSALHDLKRVIQLTGHFGIPTSVCINKFDINTGISDRIKIFAEQNRLGFAGKIEYDKSATEAQIAGKTIFEYPNGKLKIRIEKIWQNVSQMLNSLKEKETQQV